MLGMTFFTLSELSIQWVKNPTASSALGIETQFFSKLYWIWTDPMIGVDLLHANRFPHVQKHDSIQQMHSFNAIVLFICIAFVTLKFQEGREDWPIESQ